MKRRARTALIAGLLATAGLSGQATAASFSTGFTVPSTFET